ncbi:hypothetical protein NGUA35_03326 [Salmonella enterica]|uniref:Uncharacterized protein n=1 Tax=Salmonella enterica TaxID=28901 RepID=A0A379QNZ6_SALER|nr:Uncharacterised protein [Salmonella enterica]GAR08980.1 hypothetical protein NGUA03_04165 [Salmonella enterica]GAR10745.1 hypothetical protein NGUA04_01324 [Salmonella enterica]GAR33395.1 hypothetical protein NGUA09_01923 [Salmonella enterica]GAR38386.1 hypothetical protein NGUA10_02426 [Salmonella enterica]
MVRLQMTRNLLLDYDHFLKWRTLKKMLERDNIINGFLFESLNVCLIYIINIWLWNVLFVSLYMT